MILLVAGSAIAQTAEIDIPFQKFVLKNGLTLIVHEDRKAPIVAVNVWYHVGSKNEKTGKTGFAHLFEHLMFNGSEHYNQDYFQMLERIGGTDLNGTTNEDRTNYFQNVPASALDTVLFLESDRMGHLLGVIDQARLDEQRGVVQNEKRQYENQPYSIADELTTLATYPKGHPYSWTVIGFMEDLSAAALDDVKEWFKNYYGAANAVIVIAGDIDAQAAKEKVEKYFGHIPSGPPVARHERWIAKRSGEQRQVAQDRVPQSRIYKVWNIPEWKSADADYLDLVSDVLSVGKTSRLFKRLVYDDQIATAVQAYVELREIGGQFAIVATARPGVELAKVEKAIEEEMARYLKEGPTQEELERVKSRAYASFVRGVERIGGFGGKSDVLAQGEVYAGEPSYYKAKMRRTMGATAADLKRAAAEWLADGVYTLEIHPFPKYEEAKAGVERSKVPEPGAPPQLRLPKVQRATLSNGLKIVLAERHETPIVRFDLMVDSGYAADQFALPGTTKLAMDMLDEGTRTRTALQISDQLDLLGANLNTGSNLDVSLVMLNALKAKLDPSLEIFADVILNPSFPQTDFERLKKQLLAGIQQEKAQPFQMALRLFPVFLYGKGHAYGTQFTGSGTEESVQKISLEDLRKFHASWFKPNNATLVITGDTTLAEATPKLEKLFAGWKQGPVPTKNVAEVSQKEKPVIYLVDKPGAIQSVIIAGHVAPPKNDPRDIPIEVMNTSLGGMFISRLNMNLREGKHWSYGAQTVFFGARGQRPFLALAPVQTDKTKESMVEIQKELLDITASRPIDEEELKNAQDNETLTLPGSRETVNAVAGSLQDIVRYALPDDYYETYATKVRALRTTDITDTAKSVLHPDKLVWVVVGDRSKVEAGIRELNYGEVRLIDPDGNPVQ